MKNLINRNGAVPHNEGMPDYRSFTTELPPRDSGQKTMPIENTGRQSDIKNS